MTQESENLDEERLTAQVKGYLDIMGLSGVEFVPRPAAQPALAPRTDAGGPQTGTNSAVSETIMAKTERLERLYEAVARCDRCELSKTRTLTVPGEGNPDAGLVFVGEAPGADEDRTGRPFVGRAGRYLTKWINWMGFEREDVYICNTLKCRPPGNRNPKPAEMDMCRPYLEEQLAVIEPKVICAVGAFGAKAMTGRDTPIGRLRGGTYSYAGIPVICTYHPMYIIRNPTEEVRNKVKQDLGRILNDYFPGQKTGDQL